MLIWAMLDCRYKLDHIGVDSTSWKEQKRRKSDRAQSSRLDEAPSDCTFVRTTTRGSNGP
jgi:hypothetical protein